MFLDFTGCMLNVSEPPRRGRSAPQADVSVSPPSASLIKDDGDDKQHERPQKRIKDDKKVETKLL